MTKQISKPRFDRENRSHRAKPRKLDNLNIKAITALAAMKRGEMLHMEHRWFGHAWCLTGGRYVPDDVAKVVIQNASVAAVGDALFTNVLCQTWRYIESKQSKGV